MVDLFNLRLGVRCAGWFDFEHISRLNCETKMYVVQLIFKKSSKSNQCGYGWFGLCGLSRYKKYDNITDLQNKHSKF
jgi:hypothetical protein